jgi:hypothetical protein
METGTVFKDSLNRVSCPGIFKLILALQKQQSTEGMNSMITF